MPAIKMSSVDNVDEELTESVKNAADRAGITNERGQASLRAMLLAVAMAFDSDPDATTAHLIELKRIGSPKLRMHRNTLNRRRGRRGAR